MDGIILAKLVNIENPFLTILVSDRHLLVIRSFKAEYMHKTLIVLILMTILLASGSSFAQWPGCMDVAQFYKEIDSATKTWQDLYRLFKKYAGCDDGVYGEGYSEYVALSLGKYWPRLEELTQLIKKDPLFEDFVLNHIDITADPQYLKLIVNNARTHCPPNYANLCKKIEKAALSALDR